MIDNHCFSEEWLDSFKKQPEHKRIDKIILEKMIYAFHLLDALASTGLNFVFKGGTSLVLMLNEGTRFSIDIDIVCNADRSELESALDQIIRHSRFTGWALDAHRSYQPGIPKAHYKLSFNSMRQGSGTILLDVLVEDLNYPELTKLPIRTKWIKTDVEALVKVPTIDAITGDKLTAFAPNTIGIPYFKGPSRLPQSMEICKQLYDLSRLFEQISDMEVVQQSFKVFAAQEIAYRKKVPKFTNLTIPLVLQDILETCIIITKRGGETSDQRKKFEQVQRGVRSFNNFLMSGSFRIENAISASARVAFLAAKLITGNVSPIPRYSGADISPLIIEKEPWMFLNKLKKQPDKSTYYYWYLAVELLQ